MYDARITFYNKMKIEYSIFNIEYWADDRTKCLYLKFEIGTLILLFICLLIDDEFYRGSKIDNKLQSKFNLCLTSNKFSSNKTELFSLLMQYILLSKLKMHIYYFVWDFIYAYCKNMPFTKRLISHFRKSYQTYFWFCCLHDTKL